MTTSFVSRGPAEGLIEVAIDARAYGLQCHAHGFAFDGDETLEAQDVVGADDVGDLGFEGWGIGDLAADHDEALEFVVAVLVFVIMVVMIVLSSSW